MKLPRASLTCKEAGGLDGTSETLWGLHHLVGFWGLFCTLHEACTETITSHSELLLWTTVFLLLSYPTILEVLKKSNTHTKRTAIHFTLQNTAPTFLLTCSWAKK